jgi:hypothetical protein
MYIRIRTAGWIMIDYNKLKRENSMLDFIFQWIL